MLEDFTACEYAKVFVVVSVDDILLFEGTTWATPESGVPIFNESILLLSSSSYDF